MHGDHAVFDLAAGTAPLPLHAGSLVALLGHRRFVDRADDAQVVGPMGRSRSRRVQGGDTLLQAVPQAQVVPDPFGQEHLQCSHGAPRRQRDGLHALTLEIRQQPAAVGAEVVDQAAFAQAVPKHAEKFRQRRGQTRNLL